MLNNHGGLLHGNLAPIQAPNSQIVADNIMIVDGDMEGLPANAAQAMHAGAAPANPVAEALHASELLDVAVQWIAGMGMFVPSGHQRRRQPAAPREDHSDAKYARLSPR